MEAIPLLFNKQYMGRLNDLAKNGIKRYTSGDNGTEITFTSNDSPPVVVTVKGLVTDHHLKVDSWINGGAQGAVVNARVASCSVSVGLLDDADYPYRNEEDRVSLKKHRVSWELNGISKEYVVSEWYMDEGVGHLVIICEDIE